MFFVGLDLAWSARNTSGAAVIKLENKDSGRLISWNDSLQSDEEVINFIIKNVRKNSAVLAFDIPLLVPNQGGMRLADKVTNELFRQYDAGVYPANRTNLSRYGGLRGEEIVKTLARKGFVHNAYVKKQGKVRQIIEIYPHSAMVALFGLKRILKYKSRGKRWTHQTRFGAYRQLQGYLGNLGHFLPRLVIPKVLLRVAVEKLKGDNLKRYEDLLDSIFSAYIGFYYWYWGTEKCAVLGNMQEGYIVTPMTKTIWEKKILPAEWAVFKF